MRELARPILESYFESDFDSLSDFVTVFGPSGALGVELGALGPTGDGLGVEWGALGVHWG